MKPICRYTLGNVSRTGLIVLKESIKLMQKLYDFEICVCFNQVSSYHVEFVKDLGVKSCEAVPHSLSISAEVENWKLYPPRLSLDVHELVIDNDYLLTKRLEEIDLFLASDNLFLVSEDNDKNYGQFTPFVDYRFGLNSGLYGMPPGYDFAADIERLLVQYEITKWSPRFDDQGLISCLFLNKPHVMVPLWKVPFVCSNYRLVSNTYGYHFVEVNRVNNHMAWNEYTKIQYA